MPKMRNLRQMRQEFMSEMSSKSAAAERHLAKPTTVQRVARSEMLQF